MPQVAPSVEASGRQALGLLGRAVLFHLLLSVPARLPLLSVSLQALLTRQGPIEALQSHLSSPFENNFVGELPVPGGAGGGGSRQLPGHPAARPRLPRFSSIYAA